MYNYLNYGYFYARFDEVQNVFEIGHEKYGRILSDCRLHAKNRNLLNQAIRDIRLEEFGSITCGHEKYLDGKCLAVCFANGPEELPMAVLRIMLRREGVSVSFDMVKDREYYYELTGQVLWGEKPETDTFAVYSDCAGKGFFNAIGPAAGRGCDALFDRQTDRMLILTGSPAFHYDYEKEAYTFSMQLKNEDMTFDLRIQEEVLTKQYAFRNYKPMNENTVFGRPPVGWMTWYAVRNDGDDKTISEITRVQKEKLQAYGADSVWVDWEWYHPDENNFGNGVDTFHPDPEKYPNGLGAVADEIQKEGFVPCLWIAPTHEVRETEFIKECPESVLIKRRSWCGDWWFDPTHPRFLNEYIPEVFRMMCEEWGFKGFKWDAFPRSLDYYDQYHEKLYDPSVSSEQALRAVEQKAREVAGDEIYLLSCHGEGDRDITLSTDIFDAARIGSDIYDWKQFLEWGIGRLYRYYPLHNVVLYCDPDNLILREEYNTMDQAVSRASFFALMGTPITIGDDLRELPEERMELIRRAIPPMNVHPMILKSRERDTERACEVVNTFVRTRWDEYQIADVINLRERPLKYALRFTELDLEPETDYLVYDFWEQKFLGRCRHELEIELKACQSKVLLIRKVPDRPQIVSTSRHITQGAFELQKLTWDAEKRVLAGVSQTIPGETYRITAYDPQSDRETVLALTPTEELTSWEIEF